MQSVVGGGAVVELGEVDLVEERCSDDECSGGFRPGYASEIATYLSSQTSNPRCVTMMVVPRAGKELHAASRTHHTAAKISPRRTR